MQKVTALMMKCNRAVYRKDFMLVSNTRICKYISVDPPQLMCQKSAAKFIHKVISDRKPKQIYELIKFNNRHRKCSKISLTKGFSKEVSRRNIVSGSIDIFNNLKASLKYLSKRKFKRELRKMKTLEWMK